MPGSWRGSRATVGSSWQTDSPISSRGSTQRFRTPDRRIRRMRRSHWQARPISPHGTFARLAHRTGGDHAGEDITCGEDDGSWWCHASSWRARAATTPAGTKHPTTRPPPLTPPQPPRVLILATRWPSSRISRRMTGAGRSPVTETSPARPNSPTALCPLSMTSSVGSGTSRRPTRS